MTRVLVVDDNAAVRALVARLLESMGCVVRQVSGAQEALREAATAPVDLLVTDVSLEGGHSGLWLGEQVARRFPHAHVLYVSGHDRVQLLRMAAAENLSVPHLSRPESFLAKPFGLGDLRDAVTALLPCSTADPFRGSAS